MVAKVYDLEERLRASVEGKTEEQYMKDRVDSAERELGTVLDRSNLDSVFDRVATSIHTIDVDEEYAHLEKCIQPSYERGDYKTLFYYLDQCEDNARRAHRIFLASRLEHERFVKENEVVISAIRSSALRSLEGDKSAGLRTKQIAEADIRAKMMEMHSDEILRYEKKLSLIKNTEEHLEELAKLWKSRCQSARVMLETLRK